MTVLSPTEMPPSPPSLKARSSLPASRNRTKDTVSPRIQVESTLGLERDLNALAIDSESSTTTSAIPFVKLDAPVVSCAAAAHLAGTLVAHVLYLKGQIPLPVLQLARIPNAKSTPRALKLRADLLSSFDTLSSHLHTTFTALSTALSRVANPDVEDSPLHTAQVVLAIAIGPSVTISRARVMFGIDGLVVREWGVRNDGELSKSDSGEESSDEDQESETDESSEDSEGVGEDDDEDGGLHSSPRPVSAPPLPDFSSDSSSDNEDADEMVARQPISLEACPRLLSVGHRNSSHNGSIGDPETSSNVVKDDSSSRSSSLEPESKLNSVLATLVQKSKENPASQPARAQNAHHTQSHAEEQRALYSAERQLALSLAGSDKISMQELAPTQTHILLRAPRRFAHPAWSPRQNASTALSKALESFEAGEPGVEGVWVTGLDSRARKNSDTNGPTKCEAREVEEEDEMIWWSWDGKLVGFSEW